MCLTLPDEIPGGGTSSAAGHVTPVIKEEPEDEDYLCKEKMILYSLCFSDLIGMKVLNSK